MPDRLPSLNALRTFEAAARHKSFRIAAEELSVTPAAVGYQIKQLEDDLGAPLFLRRHRAVELTEVGKNLAQNLSPAFEVILDAWKNSGSPKKEKRLRITAPDNAALDWLMPAVEDARLVRSGPNISWDVSRSLRNPRADQWDVALRSVSEPDERFFCEPILRRWFTPLMRPELARLIRKETDILKHGLIQTEAESESAWPTFFRLMKLEVSPVYAMTCPGIRIALELCLKMDLLAMGGSFFGEKYLKSGRLKAPIPMAIVPKSQIWLMCEKGRENSDEVLWLRETLHQSAARILQSANNFEFFFYDGSRVKDMR